MYYKLPSPKALSLVASVLLAGCGHAAMDKQNAKLASLNPAACPTDAPSQGDACPSHGLSCNYVPASCTNAHAEYDVIALCLHGEFNVHAGLSGCF